MWHNICRSSADEVPIKSVTKWHHVRSWLSPDISFLLDRYLGDNGRAIPRPERVEAVNQIPDEEMWRALSAAAKECRVGAFDLARAGLRAGDPAPKMSPVPMKCWTPKR